ncbi:MAG: hypothetical protein ACR2QF_08880 [Geminicoccaceae bacterium]
MTDLTPIECEARLMGFKKESRADGEWTSLTFQIHPDDTPHALFLLPLKTHVTLAISGAETPAEQTQERPKGGPICKRAVLLCKNPSFRHWWMGLAAELTAGEELTKERMYERFGITTRAELDHSFAARQKFLQVERDFWVSQRGDTEEARLAQRDRT